jgi:hypothetical protein
MTNLKKQLESFHGTPAAFRTACLRAAEDGFVSMAEADAAIAKYQAEHAGAGAEKPTCPECKGKGYIELFTSRATCFCQQREPETHFNNGRIVMGVDVSKGSGLWADIEYSNSYGGAGYNARALARGTMNAAGFIRKINRDVKTVQDCMKRDARFAEALKDNQVHIRKILSPSK